MSKSKILVLGVLVTIAFLLGIIVFLMVQLNSERDSSITVYVAQDIVTSTHLAEMTAVLEQTPIVTPESTTQPTLLPTESPSLEPTATPQPMRRVVLFIDRIVCNNAQEDRVTDLINRGDELYVVYFLMGTNDRGRILDIASNHSGVIENVTAGTTIRSNQFPEVSLDISTDSNVEISIQLAESDDLSSTQALLRGLNTDLRRSIDNGIMDAGFRLTDFFINTFISDDKLGEIYEEFNVPNIERWRENTIQGQETIENQGIVTANSYTVYYTLSYELVMP